MNYKYATVCILSCAAEGAAAGGQGLPAAHMQLCLQEAGHQVPQADGPGRWLPVVNLIYSSIHTSSSYSTLPPPPLLMLVWSTWSLCGHAGSLKLLDMVNSDKQFEL